MKIRRTFFAAWALAMVGTQSVLSTDIARVMVSTIESSPIQRTDTEEAQLWGLTFDEWERYAMLMRGVRGRLSTDQISPIEVLGIHAESDAERERYAQMWAQLMLEDAERVLRFQRAYDRAIEKLTRFLPIIDPDRLASLNKNESVKLMPDDRIQFFVSLDCIVCTVVYERIAQLLNQVHGLDIFFVNTDGTKGQAVRKWAERVRIDPADARSGRVTLNLDNGTLKEHAPNAQSVPHLLLLRNGTPIEFPLELLR